MLFSMTENMNQRGDRTIWKKEEISGKEALMAVRELAESIKWLSSVTKDESYNKNIEEMQEKLEVIGQYINESEEQFDFIYGD